MVRNLAHPARYLKDHPRSRVTKKYLQRQFEVVLACRDWLAAHNNRELLKHIKEEEEKENAQHALSISHPGEVAT
jgi:hypothetical protein